MNYSHKSPVMRPILPRNKTIIRPELNKISSDYVDYKEKDVVEWNKYSYFRRKQMNEGDVPLNDYVFKDRNLYEIYVR